jgi:hypothetical protein
LELDEELLGSSLGDLVLAMFKVTQDVPYAVLTVATDTSSGLYLFAVVGVRFTFEETHDLEGTEIFASQVILRQSPSTEVVVIVLELRQACHILEVERRRISDLNTCLFQVLGLFIIGPQ